MGPKASLDTSEEKKLSCPLPATEPRFLGCAARSLVTTLAPIKSHFKIT
jgi:hypothetical protein